MFDNVIDTDRVRTDAAYQEDLRHRFLTDHFFAAAMLGFRDFSPRAHGPAVALYPPKNPNVPMQQQSISKMFLHLDPRKTFKTTLNRVDSVQWICAFPEEVAILNESATQKLAAEIGASEGAAFYQAPGAPQSILHLLYPELVLPKSPTSGTWNTPTRRRGGPGDLDFTVTFTSPQSTQSGWHPMVIKSDDVEDTENSGIGVSDEVRQNIIDKCDQNENLLREGGYKFITGTRYHPFDWYGKCLERAKRNPANWKVLVRCSVKRRDGSRFIPGEFPPEEEIELQFPEFTSLNYNALADMFYNNYESFMCQQQNDPQGGAVLRFDPKIFDSCAIEPARIPQYDGEIVICWRPRYGGDKCSEKFSEGAAARIVDGKIFVLDAWQGQYSPSTEAEKIIGAYKQHDADGLILIDVPGCEYMTANIRNEGLRRNRSVSIQRVEYEPDEARRNGAIERIEPMMKAGRICFSTAMGKAGECRKQFVNFGLIQENGIAETVSRFADLVPLSMWRANATDDELEFLARRREDALLTQFLDHQGLDAVDEDVRTKAEAHINAMSGVTNWIPSLPGGLDG